MALRKKDFDIYLLNRKVFHHTVKDTKYETLNPLVAGGTYTDLIMCKEPRVCIINIINIIIVLWLLPTSLSHHLLVQLNGCMDV